MARYIQSSCQARTTQHALTPHPPNLTWCLSCVWQKADNLLGDLRDPQNPVVKIADMGLSKRKAATTVSGNMRGTLPWMAPELFPSTHIDQVGGCAIA